jgi:hypothetical protein
MARPHMVRLDLISVQGPTNDPTGLILKLQNDSEPITITRDKPFQKIKAYSADLEYPPTKQSFVNKRKGDEIKLETDPERYKIVAITPTEVVLSANSNKRRTIIKNNASNTTASTNLMH